MNGRIRRRSLRRMLAVMVALACVAVLSLPQPRQTDAAFTDTEFTSGAQLTALRLVPPQLQSPATTCVHPLSVVVGGDVLQVKWQWTTVPYTDTVKTVSKWTINGSAAAPSVTRAGTVYTATFTRGLIAGLVGGIVASLGGSFTVAVVTQWTTPGSVVWTSQTSSTVTVTYPILGLGATTCVIANGT